MIENQHDYHYDGKGFGECRMKNLERFFFSIFLFDDLSVFFLSKEKSFGSFSHSPPPHLYLSFSGIHGKGKPVIMEMNLDFSRYSLFLNKCKKKKKLSLLSNPLVKFKEYVLK